MFNVVLHLLRSKKSHFYMILSFIYSGIIQKSFILLEMALGLIFTTYFLTSLHCDKEKKILLFEAYDGYFRRRAKGHVISMSHRERPCVRSGGVSSSVAWSPNAIPLGLRMSACKFWVDTHIQSTVHSYNSSLKQIN